MSTYLIHQWNSSYRIHQLNSVQKSLPYFKKWQVTGYNIESKSVVYLREDGTWQNEMSWGWKLDGGTYFNTRNEAEIALAKTGAIDHTNTVTAEVNKCRPR